MKRLGFIVLLVMAAHSASGYDEPTGNELLRRCRGGAYNVVDRIGTAQGKYDAGWCLGYMWGFSQGTRMFFPKGGRHQSYACVVDWCSPPGTTLGQFIDVLVKSLEAHPEDRNAPVGVLAARAFAEAWPCPKESTN